MHPPGVSGLAPCVDDEALFSLARGELAPAELPAIEAHLRDCPDCRAVLGEAARSLAPAEAEPGAAQDGPASIARYQIRALIGAGASGVVYRAFDPNLKRTVAIKVLRPDLHASSPELSARVLREAQAMARLSDPHVVAVYDVGLQDGAVYLVMEYVHGETLSDWLHAGPRSTDEILKVFRDAGRGLLAAHDKGLVHLDFKPENVLVAADGRALVTDFGLAREAEIPLSQSGFDGLESAELYAPTRGLVGTPAYMAPELFDGGTATASSDQFAFAVALFTALFGHHPFHAGEGISLEELIDRVRAGALETPAPRALNRGQSERLFAVLKRGLAPEPSARFRDLRGLLNSLERAEGRPLRRKVVLLTLAAALLLALMFGARSCSTSASTERAGPTTQMATPVAPAQRAPAPAAPPPQAAPTPPPAPVEERASTLQTPTDKTKPPASTRRRPSRKKPEVRYRDWLKDPFQR